MVSMYRKMRPLIAATFYYCGLVPLVRWWTQRLGHRVIILNYHRAAGGHLRQHLRYLQRNYHLMTLDAALAELYSHAPDGLRKADRRTPLVLTFDDGYCDNYTDGVAVAREIHAPFTIFLIPGYIDSGRHFWWDEGDHLVTQAQVREAAIDGRTYQLHWPEERAALARAIDTRVRFSPSVAEREAFLASARLALAASEHSAREEVAADERQTLPLSWSQVHEMEATGWVTYGSHTLHHSILARLIDAGEVEREVGDSRAILEQHLGHPVYAFAYPIGKVEDIGDIARSTVCKAGYKWAVTTLPGLNTPQTDPYLLRRMPTDVSEHWWVLAAQAAGVWWGIWNGLQRLRRIASRIRHMRPYRAILG